uniref:Reverse transcriptase domain-containing protein n=1 Tax=Heligmosomoides polygyrus TaxID=6339 RepID=A0A183FTW5_HELPZ
LDEKAEVVPDDPKPEPKPPEQPPDPVAEPAVSTAKNEEVPQKQDETFSVNDRGFQQMFYERPNRWHPHSHRHFMHDSDYRRSHPYRSWGWRDRGGGGSRFNRHFHDRRQWTDNSRRRGDMPRFHGDRQRWSNRGDMRFLLFAMPLYQKTSSMYGIDGATARYEATLIGGKLDDIANTSIYNSLEDFHAVREQANWTVIRAVPFFFQIGIVVLSCQLPANCRWTYPVRCGTVDAIHAVRLLLEKHREKQKPVHFAYLDLEKAFDRVPRDVIWYALREHGIPEELIEWVRILYSCPRSRVRAPAGTSMEFPISVGICAIPTALRRRDGCNLTRSPNGGILDAAVC